MDANGGDLEFALLADGVPMDKLYPLDLDRAFKSLSRIRPAIVKFWESGGMSTQMLIDREVVLSSIWSTRLAIAIEKGASLAAEWNQCRIEVQAYGIFKNTKNLSGATKFVDYATSADIQRKTYRQLPALPSNKKAYGAASKTLFNPATGEPWMTERGFMMDADYWAQHRKQTEAYWSDWIVK
jgi:putative spermidine/putrescine transport system substrate-binding protein